MNGRKKNTVQTVYELAKPIADEAGIYLWDVRFEKEGASWYLRIIIDSDDGITLDDCEAISRPLSDRLDELDFIEQTYYLEVSSPGLMRELKKPDHFEVCIGDAVILKRFRPDENGIREFSGVLKGFVEGIVTIETEQGDQDFMFSECAWVKLDDDIEFSD